MQRHLRAAETHYRLRILPGLLPGLLGLLPREGWIWRIVLSTHGVWRCQTSVLQRFAVAQRTTTLKGMERLECQGLEPGEAAGLNSSVKSLQ